MSTVPFYGAHLPGAGGGYLRIFPRFYSRFVFRRLNTRERRPAVVYLHPWEVDPDQPKLRGRLRSRLRHYTGLRGMQSKLKDLLRRHPFAPMREVLAKHPADTTLPIGKLIAGV